MSKDLLKLLEALKELKVLAKKLGQRLTIQWLLTKVYEWITDSL